MSMTTNQPDALPREVVEAAVTASDKVLTEPHAEDVVLAAVAHPAFSSWYLRRLAAMEPSGPVTVGEFMGAMSVKIPNERGGFDVLGNLGSEATCRIVAHGLNALVPPAE